MIKKHIAFVWELGSGLGHMAGFSRLAQALLDSGYQVSVIAKNVTSAAEVLGKLSINIYQAPIIKPKIDNLKATYSYAEILLDLGYKSSTDLYPLVNAWKNIFNLLTPDLIIADHSPTALVACKILELKTILIGTGFFSPPTVSPLPAFVNTQVPDVNRLPKHEKQVLCSINDVFKKFNTRTLEHLHQLFNIDEDFLCTLPELDHYPEREGVKYWGPRFDIDIGKPFTWSKTKSTKIFAYIKENTPNFESLFTALINSKKNVVLYIPQASIKVTQFCEKKKNIVLLRDPANMQQVLDQADMIVCHAGHGTVSAALLQGKRLLVVPSQLEQSMLTFLLARRRLVAAVNPHNENNNYSAAINFACTNEELGRNIELFRKKYAKFNSSLQLEDMVKSCANIIG